MVIPAKAIFSVVVCQLLWLGHPMLLFYMPYRWHIYRWNCARNRHKGINACFIAIFISEVWCYFDIRLYLTAIKGYIAFLIHIYSIFLCVIINSDLEYAANVRENFHLCIAQILLVASTSWLLTYTQSHCHNQLRKLLIMYFGLVFFFFMFFFYSREC